MDMQRKYTGRRPKGCEGRVMTVAPPSPYEGVGNALRATFRPVRNDLPDDMLDLLARLDMH
jgi:hypothetical protein